MVPHLEVRTLTKEFPGVRALDAVSFAVERGEIHALCGENGAGKSTLIKVMSGVYPAGSYEGAVWLDGEEQRFQGIRDAEAAGIAVIHQELALVPEMSVGENIFLGHELQRYGVIDWDALYARAEDLLHTLGLTMSPRTPVAHLGVGQQQLVEIAKALSRNAGLLILDEPTAALSDEEIDTLTEILHGLKARGVTCIYITHKLDEVYALADRVTVLRDGKYVGTRSVDEVDKHALIAMMVGRELTELFPKEVHEPGEVLLAVDGLTLWDPNNPARRVVDGVSFTVRAGEILGIAGLMGAGRTELLMGIFGAWPGRRAGTISVAGRAVTIRQPSDAIGHGLGLVSEDRKRYGLVLEASVVKNMSLASLADVAQRGLVDALGERQRTHAMAHDLDLRVASMEHEARTLSGGNQQKLVLGKWLLTHPRVLFLDEPTRGIDVGAKYEIYQWMNRLAAQGVAVVMVSSELPEILGLSDRILVLHEGRPAATFLRDEATQEAVMLAATGH